jgi:hypothetical protein
MADLATGRPVSDIKAQFHHYPQQHFNIHNNAQTDQAIRFTCIHIHKSGNCDGEFIISSLPYHLHQTGRGEGDGFIVSTVEDGRTIGAQELKNMAHRLICYRLKLGKTPCPNMVYHFGRNLLHNIEASK